MVEGILGRKIGMTQVFRPDGTVTPVTVIEAGPCTVTQIRTQERDGYQAVQLGFGEKKRLGKSIRGQLKNLPLHRYLREFRAQEQGDVAIGQTVDDSIFEPGEMVDVTGTSKGKGFAGVVKRHGFAGGPKTHGQSDRWRAPGSVGSTTTPGRVFKGLRMAGHMGAERVTVQSLEVIRAEPERNLLLVVGSVPGARNSLLLIRKGKKSKGKRKS
ncbi:MAG: 50S ribosomal protein L3 [Chloroflexi bacterium]|nr:50S ribosomal protein L3 [Chloroflexota bacterium]